MQRLLLFLGFMAFGSGMVYLLTVREPQRHIPAPSELPSNVLAMTGVAIRQHEAGGMRYELFAREAVYDERSQETDMTTVEFRIFEVEGVAAPQLKVTATAGRAFLNKKRGSITLREHVHVVSTRGAELRSELVHYLDDGRRVIVPGQVWVKAGDAFHEGSSLIYDIPLERMTFTAPTFYQ